MEDKQKIYVVVALAVLVSLVLSCIAGALAGGVAGLVVGRHQAESAVERVLESGSGTLPEFRQWSMPGAEDLPFELLPDREGALIVDVIAGSPAAEEGLRAGDIITAIDRTPIDQNHPLPQVIGQYRPGDRVTIHFWRAGQEQAIQLQLAANPDDPAQAYLGVYFRMTESPALQLPSD